MEWIKINQNKLKVMLTAEDAARYALQPESADPANDLTRRAFRAILTDMRAEADFDAAEDRVYIQMYPSREGGCELFITRMGIDMTVSPRGARTYQKKESARELRSLAFCFESMNRLIAVCRRLQETGYRGESAALLDDCRRYWLLLTENGNPTTAREDYRFVREYGEMESKEAAELMLSEHGKHLCKTQAVETLGVL